MQASRMPPRSAWLAMQYKSGLQCLEVWQSQLQPEKIRMASAYMLNSTFELVFHTLKKKTLESQKPNETLFWKCEKSYNHQKVYEHKKARSAIDLAFKLIIGLQAAILILGAIPRAAFEEIVIGLDIRS
jgi:hypothetical protein